MNFGMKRSTSAPMAAAPAVIRTQQADIGGDERADAAQPRISFRNRRERRAEIRPHACRHDPAEKVQVYEEAQRKHENHAYR